MAVPRNRTRSPREPGCGAHAADCQERPPSGDIRDGGVELRQRWRRSRCCADRTRHIENVYAKLGMHGQAARAAVAACAARHDLG